jgi:FkbM family methyltransferase
MDSNLRLADNCSALRRLLSASVSANLISYVHSKFPRLLEFLVDSTYRKILFFRLLIFLLRKINPHIKYLGLDIDGEKTFLFTEDAGVTPTTAVLGRFQFEDFTRALAILKKSKLLKPGIFLDIGANVGTQTIYALHTEIFHKAYCFEPVTANLDLLKLNLYANKLTDSAVVVPMALSDKEGKSRMALSPVNFGDHRVILDHQIEQSKEIQTIASTTLDSYMASQNLAASAISLIWMDTQGHEAHVLSGAAKALQEQIPMVTEFWPWALRKTDNYDRLLDLIEKHYGNFYDLGDASLTKRPTKEIKQYAATVKAVETFSTDFLLIP